MPLPLLVMTGLALGQVAPPGDFWQSWSADVFARAARADKFVLLNIEAPWCHWCSVMDRDTYGDEDVRKLIDGHYVAAKVEQDSRPDIASRYKDYDLPATIIFHNDGTEIARTQGFRSPARMVALLQAVIDDPSPAPSATPEAAITYAAEPFLPPDVSALLGRRFLTQYELADQGLSFATRYVDADFLDYAIELAQHGDDAGEERARAALRAMQSLLDPVSGGMHQSLVVAPGASGLASRYTRIQVGGKVDRDGDHWNEPHFEKLLSVQAQSIRMYARAYARWHMAQDLAAAENVHAYVRRFLASPGHAFYASQAGDVASVEDSLAYFALDAAGRSRIGVPMVDRHQYTRENAWMIAALCALYAVTGDATTLDEAQEAARWIAQRRGRADGGYAHGEHDRGGPYLGDTLAAGEAFLALYEVTANRDWLQRAEQAAHYIAQNFPAGQDAGFASSNSAAFPAYRPHPDRDENAHVARFANLLAHYTGCDSDGRIAARAMRYLASREVALAGLAAPVLLAEAQFTRAPERIIVVGARKDAKALALFRTALGTGPAYRQLEWVDVADQIALPSGVAIAGSDQAVAFVCSRTRCSPPISDPYVFTSLVANGR